MPTSIGYNDAMAQKMYRSGVTLAAQLQTYSFNFLGKEERSGIVEEDREGARRGESLEVRFADINHDEEPKVRLSQVIGQESSTPRYTDKLSIRYFLFDGAVENLAADQQLVSFDLKQGEIERIARQWAYTWDKAWLNQLAGNTVVNTAADYGLCGGNEVTAQDSSHLLFAPGTAAHTTTAAVGGDTTAVMTTGLLKTAVRRMTSRNYVKFPAAPCTTPFGDLFVCIVGEDGYDQIRRNAATSDFYDIQKAAIQGGEGFRDNPIITGEGFIHEGVLVLKSTFMPKALATSSTYQANTRIAVVFGARACHLLWGEGFANSDHLGWSEHVIHRRWSGLADTVYGLKRTIVDSQSWSSTAICHYAEA